MEESRHVMSGLFFANIFDFGLSLLELLYPGGGVFFTNGFF